MEAKIRDLKEEVKRLHAFLKELVDDYSLPGKFCNSAEHLLLRIQEMAESNVQVYTEEEIEAIYTRVHGAETTEIEPT